MLSVPKRLLVRFLGVCAVGFALLVIYGTARGTVIPGWRSLHWPSADATVTEVTTGGKVRYDYYVDGAPHSGSDPVGERRASEYSKEDAVKISYNPHDVQETRLIPGVRMDDVAPWLFYSFPVMAFAVFGIAMIVTGGTSK